MTPMRRFLAVAAALALLAAMAVANPGWMSRAQDGDSQAATYPIAIHEGTCEEMTGQPLFDLGATSPFGLDQEDAGLQGSEASIPVVTLETTMESSYDQLMGSDHVVAVHLSAEEFGTLAACGAIGGIVDGGRLSMGLNPVDQSGVAGVVVFDDDTGGTLGLEDNELLVRVFLLASLEWAPPEAADAEAAPSPTPPAEEESEEPAPTQAAEEEATPAEEEESAPPAEEEGQEDGGAQEAVEVEAVDIDFNPNEFTIAADTDVTVTIINNGEQLHTFTIDELDINVEIDPGATEEVTINAEAGEYVYYCTVPGHREAGQEGTMTVE